MSGFKGQKELLKALEQFPTNVQRNVLTGAIRAGAKPLVASVKANVPKKTGNLKKSIGIIKRKSKDKSKVRFSVTARKGGKNDGFYAHLLEFGTSKMAAIPMFRPAYESQGRESIEAAKDYLAKRIDKEIAKAKK